MEVESLLAIEANALYEQEVEMKKKLEEIRRTSISAAKASWQENLNLVCFNSTEKKTWATAIEKDVMEQKSIKKQPVSRVFVEGPQVNKSLVLAKLLLKASMEAKVQLPKKVITDLEKSGLVPRFTDLMNSSDGQEQQQE